MRGIICEDVNQFRVMEQEPPRLSPGMAIVRIRRIGICGTDYHAYRGNQPFFSYPRVLGHELAGVIEAIDDTAGSCADQKSLKPGDQVGIIPYLECGECIACRRGKTNCCVNMKVMGVHVDGGMRELVAIPISNLIAADGLTLDETAALEPLSIGAHAVRRAGIEEGETVMVIGGGPIGLGVMALAKHKGARVLAMDVQDERLAFCREWAKVDETVNALQEAGSRVEQLTDGDYPTVVFDCTGNPSSMTKAFGYVAHGGKLVYVGLAKADISFNDPDFHKRELTLMGSRNATKEDFLLVKQAIRAGALNISAYITHRAPFEGMIDQFEQWMKPESKVIKAMVEL
ncbi:zinc-binding alcohol dehydrogenase family protein [Paenibacillus sp. HB172176]|uniref:zinc-binding alcohol dehydrogenase family protein n=1 Tax=Paenibacillus sp. HB172176 TaxID=2493690 RepID=UPI00143A62F0|nr:zinc-binding alcohol dehydrogenase family protein [Paenibacillus sp. HB172176]